MLPFSPLQLIALAIVGSTPSERAGSPPFTEFPADMSSSQAAHDSHVASSCDVVGQEGRHGHEAAAEDAGGCGLAAERPGESNTWETTFDGVDISLWARATPPHEIKNFSKMSPLVSQSSP